MDDSNYTSFEVARRLEAENESLKSILQEYRMAASAKEMQARVLEEQVSESAAAKSNYELQAEELKLVKIYVHDLMQQAEAAAEREAILEKQVSHAVSANYQLEEIKSKYNYLLVQLDDLSQRLHQLHTQNLLHVQYMHRVAELESLLANAEEEIDELKKPSGKS